MLPKRWAIACFVLSLGMMFGVVKGLEGQTPDLIISAPPSPSMISNPDLLQALQSPSTILDAPQLPPLPLQLVSPPPLQATSLQVPEAKKSPTDEPAVPDGVDDLRRSLEAFDRKSREPAPMPLVQPPNNIKPMPLPNDPPMPLVQQPKDVKPMPLPNDPAPVPLVQQPKDVTPMPLVQQPKDVTLMPKVDAGGEELRRRLDDLEKQNRDLIQTLKQIQEKTPFAKDTKSEEAKEAPSSTKEKSSVLSKTDVNKLIGDAFKTRDEKKKADEEAKKKEEQEKGFVVGDVLDMKVKWLHGVWMETPDKAFRYHVGGRTQIDVVGTAASDNVQFSKGGFGAYQSAVNFRRARLDAEGTLWEVINFYSQFDFVNTVDDDPSVAHKTTSSTVINTPAPTDLWIEIASIPILGHLRLGNSKPPIGMDHMTSSRFLPFMERSLPFDAFIEEGNNGFSPGFGIWNTIGEDKIGTYSVGLWKTDQRIFGWSVGNGGWGEVGRLTWLPIYADEGRYLLHLGMGASYKDPDNGIVRWRSRPEIRNGPAVLHNIAAITRVQADHESLFVPEIAGNIGPFTFQAEYMAGYLNGVNGIIATPTQTVLPISSRSYFAQGTYVQALYFLTGEHTNYNKDAGAFGRITPFRNYYFVPGAAGSSLFQGGAWQVGLRYSYLDLNNNGIEGGQVNELTAGLNWYLNPNVKIQGNYIYGYRSVNAAGSGAYQALGIRFAIDF